MIFYFCKKNSPHLGVARPGGGLITHDYRFPILKLPPPPCAVLLVYQQIEESSINGWCLKFDDSDMKLQKYSNEKIYLFIDHHCKNALEVCYIIMMMLHNFETARGQYLTKFYDTKHFC